MSKRLSGLNSLAYIGVEPLSPPNSVEARRNPEPNDFKSFNVGDMWVNTLTNQAFIFTSKNSSGGIWAEIAAAAGGGAENFITDVGTAVVSATNIDILGGSLITTDALTPNTVTISLDNGTDGQIIIGATAGNPAYGNLTSTGGTITISEGPNTLNIEADTSGFADHYPTDFGTAQPTAGVLNILGGDNISTSGASNTVTVNLTNGTNGQLLIGGGATAEWQNLTSTGHTIVITNGANSINLEAASSGANTFTTNSGVATQALNNINVLGGNVVTTTGTGSTVTVKLTNGTNGQLLIGGGANPAWATLTSTGGTVTFTPGANSLNLEATGMGAGASTFNTDSGSATEALGAINIFGGELINTSGAAATVGINLDRGTDGQLIIGRTGGASAYANLTSTGGSVVITNGPNSINLEATGTGAGASSFPTDSGTATEAAGVLGIAGGTNIQTSGATNEVTVKVIDSPSFSGNVFVGNGLQIAAGGLQVDADGIIADGDINFTSLTTGVMRILGTTVVSSNGADGEILIGGGAAPEWANITSNDASVVITNGANSIDLSVPAAGSGTKVTQFTSSGTWTKAAGTKMVTVIGWCGGGGGASGGRQPAQMATGGGGGGQGSVFYFTAPAIFFGATEPVVVGVGGTGGAGRGTNNVNGNDGNPGTISSFGLIIPPQIANQGSGTPGQASGGLSGQMFDLGNSIKTISLSSGNQLPITLDLNGQVTGTGRFRGGGVGGSGVGGFAAGVGGATNSTGHFYSYLFGTGGGGGGGTNTSASTTNGSAGGNITAFDAVTLIQAGGTAGTSGTPAGGNGSSATLTGGLMFGGRGGGGGAGQTNVSAPGKGGDGGFPGGGGGGGGGSINGTTSGAGGKGGDGLVIVIEW